MVALRAGSATDVGRVRSNNQDSFLLADPLYAVADGMGGAAAGEVASALAVEALGNGFARSGPPTAESLVSAARAANRAVWDEAEANPEMRGMGTTLVAVALVDATADDADEGDDGNAGTAGTGPADQQLAIINVGDSRLYVLHRDQLRQITYDHNLVAEMVAEGRITPAEAEVHPRRNIMTRALGVEPEVPVDLFVEAARPGDRYLLCSDGLPREISDDLIASYLRRYADPREAARELVEEAKRRGGNDNITVVVVDVVDDSAPPPAPEALAAPSPADLTTALPASPVSPAEIDRTTAVAVVDAFPPPRTGSPTRPGLVRRTRSALTVRVVMFVLLLAIIVVAAGAGIVWYARATYYVGLDGDQVVVYQGRPGGVLGLDPTLREYTHVTTAQVLSSALPALRSGQEVSSLAAANSYVANLVAAYQTAQQAGQPAAGPTGVSSPTTSVNPSPNRSSTTVAS